MKQIFTILAVLLFISHTNALPPDISQEKLKLPKTLDRFIPAIKPEIKRSDQVSFEILRKSIIQHVDIVVAKNQQIRLDSIIEVYTDYEDDRQVFSYDEQGRLTAMTYSEKIDGAWVVDTRLEYTYTSGNQIATYTLYSLEEEELLAWIRYLYVYENDLTTKEEMYVWDEDENDWSLLVVTEYAYDNNKNLLTETTYFSYMEIMMGTSKEEYTYDASGNNTMVIEYSSDFMGGWEPYSKREFTYNAANLEIQYISYTWEDGEWENEYRESTTYSGNLMSELISQYWEDGSWVNYSKDTYNYSGNRLMLLITMEWGDDGQWVNEYKEEYEYNSQGSLTLIFWSEWVEGSWVPIDKTEISYDTSQSAQNLIYPFDWLSGFGMVTGYVISDWVDGGWVLHSQATFYWSGGSATSAPSLNRSDVVNIYPNPASDFVMVSVDHPNETLDVYLYDMQGRLVLRQAITNNSSINTGQLNRGIYMFVIQADGLYSTQKLIIQ